MAQQSNQASIAEAQAQLQYLYNVYTQQHGLLENELAALRMTSAAITRNIETLENKERLSGSKILINGEGGAYFTATMDSIDKILVYVGAGYLIEKEASQALDYLKANYKKQDEIIRKLNADKQSVEKELVSITYNLSQMEQQRQ
jgi:prefoldin alpha subunit